LSLKTSKEAFSLRLRTPEFFKVAWAFPLLSLKTSSSLNLCK
jgi:hypothetical protein